MGFFDDVFDFFFGWLIPDEEYMGGVELKLGKPADEPIVYGQAIGVQGVTVASHIVNPIDNDDIPNELLYLQIVWSVGDIEEVTQIYLDDEPIDSTKFLHEGGNRWAYHWNYIAGENIDFSTLDGGTLSFKSNGFSYTVIRLTYDPDKMNRLPKITADIKGIKVTPVGGGAKVYSTNYADILNDYLTNPNYGRGLNSGRINQAALVAEKAFSSALVYPYIGSPSYQPIMSCNIRLDGNNTLLSNVNKILKGCRGFLPYIEGQFHFIIERDRAAIVGFEIDDTNRLSDFVVEDVEIKDYYNKVTVRFKDRAQKGKLGNAVYPVDSAEHAQYLADDGGIPYEKTLTIDTINNEYEALQMAEIILKRSRNALKVKVSCKSEAKVTGVGQVVNTSNEAFGMVQKPFIVVNKKTKASGVVDLELLEYQGSIYPWNEKDEQIIPDTTVADYTLVNTPTDLAVNFPNDGVNQVMITWTSAYNEFLVSQLYEGEGGQLFFRDSTAVTGNLFMPFNGLSEGVKRVGVRAINGLGYKSNSVSIDFSIVLPVIPELTFTVGNFGIDVIPEIKDVPVTGSVITPIAHKFELLLGLTNIQGNAVNKGYADVFNIDKLIPDTDYWVWVRTVNPVGVSAWVELPFKTLNDPSVLGTFLNIRSLRLLTDTHVFAYDSEEPPAITPSIINFTADVANVDILSDPLIWTSSPTVTLGGTGLTRTLTNVNFDALGVDAVSVTVATTSGSFTDTVTLIKLVGGGADGVTPVVGYLTNEAYVISADKDGVITGNLADANGVFKVYSGVTDVTTSAAFSQTGATGMVATINATTGAYTISSMSADNGYVDFRAIYSGITLIKRFDIAKSKVGDTGAKGDTGNTGAAAPEKYSWTVYSDSMTTGTIYTSNTPTRTYTGVVHDQLSATPSLGSHGVYNWYLSVDVIDLSDATILANTLNANHIDVNSIMATNLKITKRLEAGSTIKTIIQDSDDSFSIWNGNTRIFGVNAGLGMFTGLLAPATVTYDMLTDGAKASLMPNITGATGGNESVSNVVLPTLGTSLSISVPNTNDINISVVITDSWLSGEGEVLIAPVWLVNIYRGTATGTLIKSQNVTGDVSVIVGWDFYNLTLDGTVTFTDTTPEMGSGQYTVVVSLTSGNSLSPKMTAFSISQQVSDSGLGSNALTLGGQAGAYYLDWNNFTSIPSTFTPSAHSHNTIDVVDTRAAAKLPNQMADKTISSRFTNIEGAYGGDWSSILSVTGWTSGAYYTWELASSSSTATDGKLRFRYGVGATWGAWEEVLTNVSFGKTEIDALAINADKINGYDSSAFALLIAGQNTFQNQCVFTGQASIPTRLGVLIGNQTEVFEDANGGWLGSSVGIGGVGYVGVKDGIPAVFTDTYYAIYHSGNLTPVVTTAPNTFTATQTFNAGFTVPVNTYLNDTNGANRMYFYSGGANIIKGGASLDTSPIADFRDARNTVGAYIYGNGDATFRFNQSRKVKVGRNINYADTSTSNASGIIYSSTIGATPIVGFGSWWNGSNSTLTTAFAVGTGSGWYNGSLLKLTAAGALGTAASITSPILAVNALVGSTGNGYFYSDFAGRTAFTGGDFYIQSGVANAYNYASNNYHGGSSGDAQLFRGNTLSGDNWSLTGAGVFATGGIVHANAGISQDGNTILNGSDTWLRTTGDTGWYSSTYGGGWHMTDSTYVKVYNGRAIKTTSTSVDSFKTDGGVQLAGTANYGRGVTGLYSSTRFQGVFSMGAAYQLPLDGTTSGNLYGIAWTHSNNANANGNKISGHHACFMTNGVTKSAIGDHIWTSGTVSGSEVTYTCDENIKTDIEQMKNASKIRRGWDGKTFTKDGKETGGLIAQQIQANFGIGVNVTKTDRKDKYGEQMSKLLTLNISPIIGVLVQAANEDYTYFEDKIDKQQQEIDELKAMVKALAEKVGE